MGLVRPGARLALHCLHGHAKNAVCAMPAQARRLFEPILSLDSLSAYSRTYFLPNLAQRTLLSL
jgi:hypothetical protein